MDKLPWRAVAARQLNSSQLILQATVAAEGSARSIRAMVLVLAKSARQMMSSKEETTPWWHLLDESHTQTMVLPGKGAT